MHFFGPDEAVTKRDNARPTTVHSPPVMRFSFDFAVHFGVVKEIQPLRIVSRRAKIDLVYSDDTRRGRHLTVDKWWNRFDNHLFPGCMGPCRS